MTKREATIILAYIGYLIGDIDKMYKYINEIMGRTVFTHEVSILFDEIREKADEWISIEEEFPEENEYVDITFIYKDDDDIDYDYYTDVARYYCKMWIDGHGMPIIGEVIAWKPRPEPYRKEQER